MYSMPIQRTIKHEVKINIFSDMQKHKFSSLYSFQRKIVDNKPQQNNAKNKTKTKTTQRKIEIPANPQDIQVKNFGMCQESN